MVDAVDPTTVIRTSPSGVPLARSVTRPVTLPPWAHAVEAATRLNSNVSAVRTRTILILMGLAPVVEAEHPIHQPRRDRLASRPQYTAKGPDDNVTRPRIP